MPGEFPHRAALRVYGFLWHLAAPCFTLNQRLAQGLPERAFQNPLPPASIWIQAASAGESYLALLLFKSLKGSAISNILLTSSTVQGVDILKRGVAGDGAHCSGGAQGTVSYFPFDDPQLMKRVVEVVRPRVMVLMESEIWPGLLSALGAMGCRILVINGRMTERSLTRYRLWPGFWRGLAPDKVLAVSQDDADRFRWLFGLEDVAVMPNMKFDRFTPYGFQREGRNPIAHILPAGSPFLVLASVRRQEEALVEKIIRRIQARLPETVIGVFPKHMHRIESWERRVGQMKVPWALRSKCRGPVTPGTVLLGDRFGELARAYELSRAAFVGGSLLRLGGQNFLEALMCGVRPVIGPHWNNFKWVGSGLAEKGLVRVGADWQEVSSLLIEDLERKAAREVVKAAAWEYVESRQGGTALARQAVERLLSGALGES